MTDPVPPVPHEAQAERPELPSPGSAAPGAPGSTLGLIESLNIRRVELELAEQQLQAECESLAAQRDRYRRLFDTLPLPAVVMESNGTLCGANDLALALLGIDENDVIRGRRLCSSLHPGCQQAMVRAVAERERVTSVNAELRCPDGRLMPCTLHVSPLTEPDVQQWLVVLAVTHAADDPQSRLSEATSARARAEQANSAKDAFLAHMSHEVRTPMNNLMGLLRMVLDTPLTAEQRKYLTLASESADDLLTIANDIVDLSRMEAGALPIAAVPLAPREVLQSSLEKFQSLAGAKGLKLSGHCTPDVPQWWTGDPVRLRQVLGNLISNAVKFTAQGFVRIELSRLPDTAAGLVALCVAVHDSGIGFDAAAAERLFNPFVQADDTIASTYGGAGLGLTISRRLVELMGGTIQCSSEPGQGSVFRFTLVGAPAATPMAVATDPAPPVTVATRALRVLVAEDHPINQLVAQTMLKELGHTCTVVGDGLAALEALRTDSFDLVLMDVMMPRMDGASAVRALRAAEPAGRRPVPVVMFTAHAMSGDRERFLATGADGYLSKPITMESLRSELARVMAA